MAKAQYTPGPWLIKNMLGTNHYSLWTRDGDYATDCDNAEEAEANAALIAAAPELLEQLEALVKWAETKNAFPITQTARAVIKKAKGN